MLIFHRFLYVYQVTLFFSGIGLRIPLGTWFVEPESPQNPLVDGRGTLRPFFLRTILKGFIKHGDFAGKSPQSHDHLPLWSTTRAVESGHLWLIYQKRWIFFQFANC